MGDYLEFCCLGEDGGIINIWNMSPIKDEKFQKDESVPKTLAQMDDHTGSLFSFVYHFNKKRPKKSLCNRIQVCSGLFDLKNRMFFTY